MGPLYNQPDWQLVSEESLVKNLVLGNQISKQYGKRMNIGWLLDNFGQISQTSQILKNADLEGIYVWRGVEMDPKNVTSPHHRLIHCHMCLVAWASANVFSMGRGISAEQIKKRFSLAYLQFVEFEVQLLVCFLTRALS